MITQTRRTQIAQLLYTFEFIASCWLAQFEREVAYSNPVSGDQCHLIYLTVLLYVHKRGIKPHSFII